MTVRRVDAWFFSCDFEGGVNFFHHKMIQFLYELGAEFYKSAPFPPPIMLDPESKIKPDGRLIGSIRSTHPLLNTAIESDEVKKGFLALYGDGICDKSFRISASGWRDDREGFETIIQQLATGRVEFLKLIVSKMGVKIAFVDDVWGTKFTDKSLDEVKCRHLFWTTYFGPRYVEKYGREFLLNTPAFKTEELEGGVLITVTEKFLDFALNDPNETLKYLRQEFKGMRANRFKIHEAF
ncbi:hypothetical protein [Novipirellula sp.]|uniref:hypothetical protein n=1 Tax=Novipirellula sp. TaxID=2795430 RepID=UPI003562F5FC